MYGYGVVDFKVNLTAPQWHEPFSFMIVLFPLGHHHSATGPEQASIDPLR
jgi:hypothetical protein